MFMSLCFAPLLYQVVMSQCLFNTSPSVKPSCLSLSLSECVTSCFMLIVCQSFNFCFPCLVSQIVFSCVPQVCPLCSNLLCIYCLSPSVSHCPHNLCIPMQFLSLQFHSFLNICVFVSSCTAINLPPFFIHHICCSIIAAMLYLQLPLLQSSPNCSNTEITAACRWSLSTLEIKQNQIHERTEIQIEDLKDRKINGVMK